MQEKEFAAANAGVEGNRTWPQARAATPENAVRRRARNYPFDEKNEQGRTTSDTFDAIAQ